MVLNVLMLKGCTAPQYSKDSLHAAVVEVYVGKNAEVCYSSVQNWSAICLNSNKACTVDAGGAMEWIDGNIGSKFRKYPSCILAGRCDRSLYLQLV